MWRTPNSWRGVFKLKKYIVFQAHELDVNSNPTGKIYTGRTSGSDNMSTQQILNKRKSNHHRNPGGMEPVSEIKSLEKQLIR